jgi:hypothetical protein
MKKKAADDREKNSIKQRKEVEARLLSSPEPRAEPKLPQKARDAPTRQSPSTLTSSSKKRRGNPKPQKKGTNKSKAPSQMPEMERSPGELQCAEEKEFLERCGVLVKSLPSKGLGRRSLPLKGLGDFTLKNRRENRCKNRLRREVEARRRIKTSDAYIRVHPTDTVATSKSLIEKKTGVLPDRQSSRLVNTSPPLRDRELGNGLTVQDCGIEQPPTFRLAGVQLFCKDLIGKVSWLNSSFFFPLKYLLTHLSPSTQPRNLFLRLMLSIPTCQLQFWMSRVLSVTSRESPLKGCG